MLKAIGCTGVEKLAPFGIAYFPFAGTELMVSRTGFTGDLGYELWIDPSKAIDLWDALFDKGANHGIRPMGTHALEVARIEAGFIQAHVDFLPADQAIRLDRSRSPFELDLALAGGFQEAEFQRPARAARRAEARPALSPRASGHRGQQARALRRTSTTRRRNGDVVGTVTSAEWSPSAKANIALASLNMPWGRKGDDLWAEIYYQRELKWSKVMARCRVVEGAFYDPPRRRATPAADF